jgi:short-subunit dehydrogenase
MGRIERFTNLGCLVTGASSGIGREIALLLAAEGARIAVSARRRERLEALVAELRAAGAPAAYALVADLDEPAAAVRLAEEAEACLGQVDVLVNNAGFAVPGMFTNTDPERTQSMVRVNIAAPLALTARLLPSMVKRNAGGILNVASVAGYQAAPYQSAYAGTKAFLLNWSDGLHQEYKHTQVAITVLCPGVTDTEFFDAAGYKKLTGFLNRRMDATKVARVGVEALRRGKMEAISGFTNKVVVFIQRFLPRRFVASVSRRLMGGRPLPTRRH